MNYKEFKEPQRVWINKPDDSLHGTCAIAVLKKHTGREPEIIIYFTEGRILQMNIDPIYLVNKKP